MSQVVVKSKDDCISLVYQTVYCLYCKSTGKIEIIITCICFRSSPHTGRKKPKKKKSMLEERPLLDPGPPPSGKLVAIKRDTGQGHSA